MIPARGKLTPGRALLAGALAVGILDALDAIIFFGLRGVRPERIFQSIASGLLGRSAFQGGAATMALGAALHFTNAFLIVGFFHLVSTRLPALRDRPLLWGPLYGIAVYFVMNYVVIPLSAANHGAFSLPVFANGITIHIFGVGLPAALSAQVATRRSSTAISY